MTNYYVVYESNDCTGQGYIFYDETVPTPTAIVFTRYDTSTVSYIARGTQPVLIQVGSNYDGFCNIDYGYGNHGKVVRWQRVVTARLFEQTGLWHMIEMEQRKESWIRSAAFEKRA